MSDVRGQTGAQAGIHPAPAEVAQEAFLPGLYLGLREFEALGGES